MEKLFCPKFILNFFLSFSFSLFLYLTLYLRTQNNDGYIYVCQPFIFLVGLDLFLLNWLLCVLFPKRCVTKFFIFLFGMRKRDEISVKIEIEMEASIWWKTKKKNTKTKSRLQDMILILTYAKQSSLSSTWVDHCDAFRLHSLCLPLSF